MEGVAHSEEDGHATVEGAANSDHGGYEIISGLRLLKSAATKLCNGLRILKSVTTQGLVYAIPIGFRIRDSYMRSHAGLEYSSPE